MVPSGCDTPVLTAAAAHSLALSAASFSTTNAPIASPEYIKQEEPSLRPLLVSSLRPPAAKHAHWHRHTISRIGVVGGSGLHGSNQCPQGSRPQHLANGIVDVRHTNAHLRREHVHVGPLL